MKKHCFTASCLLVLSTAALTVNSASAQTNFGSLSIGHSASQSVTVNIPQGGTVSAIEVLTGGGANLDFNNAGGGSCIVGKSYVVNSSCTVEVSFQPTAPGARYGGVTLQLTGAGLPTFSTAYLEGIGLGGQTSFSPESPVLLGTIGNLSGVQSDGRGYVFYTAAGIEEGGEPVAAGSFGSFSGAEGLYGEPRIQSPSGVAIDGAGTACIFDPLVGATDIFFRLEAHSTNTHLPQFARAPRFLTGPGMLIRCRDQPRRRAKRTDLMFNRPCRT